MRTPREVSESYWAAECRRDIDAVMALTDLLAARAKVDLRSTGRT